MSVSVLRSRVAPGTRVRLEPYLDGMNLTTLRQIVPVYGGAYDRKQSKEDCLWALERALADPAALRRTLSGLKEYQAFALWQLERAGGSMSAAELTAATWVSGFPYPHGNTPDQESTAVLQALMDRGLVLAADPNSYGYGYGYDTGLSGKLGATVAFADERLLDLASPMAPAPLSLSPVRGPARAIARRPAEVALSIGRLIEGIGASPLPLTATGRPKKPALNRVAKLLGVNAVSSEPPARALEDQAGFLMGLLRGAGILSLDLTTREAVLTEDATDRIREPFAQQARWWVRGYRSLTGWAEFLSRSYYYPEELYAPGKLNALRAALLTGLAALPQPEEWYRFWDFACCLEPALSGRLSLLPLPTHYNWGRTDAERKQLAEKYRKDVETNWAMSEYPWLDHAMRGALYHLGLVELGEDDAEPPGLLFRLSATGVDAIWRAARGESRAAADLSPATHASGTASCWLVQANMDVIVFLDRVSAERLAFIGRVADHTSALNHTAQYQLTRDSVYRALESGQDAAGILDGLAAASEQPLPEVVRRTVQGWAARRERIRIHQDALVLEFPDGPTREQAVARLKLRGSPIGERLFRLAPGPLSSALQAEISHQIEYSLPPERTLSVGDDGTIRARTAPDLVMRELLSHWAEELPDRQEWRLTAESVSRAARAGMPVMQLDAALEERMREGAFSPLLRIALRAWAAGRPRSGASVSIETVLHLDDPELIRAVEESTVLRPYLVRQLGPGSYVVAAGDAEELKALLATFGLEVGTALATQARTVRRRT